MSSAPRRSIVTRLAVTFALGAGVLLLGVVVSTYVLVGRQLAVQLDDRLEEQALAMVADVDPEDAGDPIALAEDLWGETGPPPVDAQLVRSDGTVVASTGAVPGGGGLVDAATAAQIVDGQIGRGTIEVDDTVLRMHVRPVPGTDLVLVVASDLEPVTGPRQTLLAVTVPVGVVGVTALAGLAWAATRRELRPLERMADRAEQVGVHDLRVRLPVSADGDELDRLAATINRMLDRLEDAIERERRFTADASHELRTPLAIIRAELELAEPGADATVRARLVSAREEVDRLTGLVDDLLVLARADADRLDGDRPVDLGVLVGAVLQRFVPLAAQADVVLEGQGAGIVVGDGHGLDRALTNLVANAVRHTPIGGNVHLDARVDDGVATLTVRDTGPGIPAERLASMFDRFTRLDDARTTGGAGLGLAIVGAVAAAHGGRVDACNRAGGGLEVTIAIDTARSRPDTEPRT